MGYGGNRKRPFIEVDNEQLRTDLTSLLAENTTKLDDVTYKTFYMSKYKVSDGNISVFISNKIQEGYRKFIFPKGFILNETLNLEHIRNNGIGEGVTIEGAGGIDVSNYDPHIILNTGGVGIRMRETHSCTLKNIALSSADSRATNKSSIGVILTRDSAFSGVGSSISNDLINVSVKMHKSDAINQGYGTIGIYNNTAEITHYEGLQIEANTPIILSRYDSLDICPENTYNGSNKDHYFVGRNLITSLGGSGSRCMVIDGAETVNGSFYFTTSNSSPDSCVIEVSNRFYVGDLKFDCENTPIVFKIKDSLMDHVHVLGFFTHIAKFIVATKNINVGRMVGCRFNGYFAYKSDVTEKILLEQGTGFGVNSCNFILSNDTSGIILNISGYFAANTIHSSAKPTMNFLAGSTNLSNTVIAEGGVFFNERRVSASFGSPENIAYLKPFKSGDVFFNYNFGLTGDAFAYIHDGTKFRAIGQNGHRGITSTNVANETPRNKGEIVFDENNNAWIAYGTLVGQFKKMTS